METGVVLATILLLPFLAHLPTAKLKKNTKGYFLATPLQLAHFAFITGVTVAVGMLGGVRNHGGLTAFMHAVLWGTEKYYPILVEKNSSLLKEGLVVLAGAP